MVCKHFVINKLKIFPDETLENLLNGNNVREDEVWGIGYVIKLFKSWGVKITNFRQPAMI